MVPFNQILHKVCIHEKVIVRCLRTIPKSRRVIDPGIQRRKQLIADDQNLEQLNDYDFDLEADFMNLGKSYKEHVEDIRNQQERVKHYIVNQKYFKQTLPNFLTWVDKEQIRYLYNNDPQEWTVDKLSEGFPALPHIIKKIIKSTWTKKSQNDIDKHDKSVEENWKLFKEGKLENIPHELIHHLKKFTDRKVTKQNINYNVQEIRSSKLSKSKKPTEFSDIISSYEKLKNKNTNEEVHIDQSMPKKPPNKDTYVMNSYKHSKHITLSSLENKLRNKSENDKVYPDEEGLLIELKQENLQRDKSIKPVQVEPTSIEQYNIKTSISTKIKRVQDDYLLEYPERITIPQNLLKKGHTYKLNDCYYDDDGEFLYRVPGMYN